MQAQPQDEHGAAPRLRWAHDLRANLRQHAESSLTGYGIAVLAYLATLLAAQTQPPDAAMASALRAVLSGYLRPTAHVCRDALVLNIAVCVAFEVLLWVLAGPYEPELLPALPMLADNRDRAGDYGRWMQQFLLGMAEE
ncbi:uncharacterized protein PpBr36_09523 [Pyricularia pennisetigena]|uniref:uncharacterized protein n=1 Tax=Pyricularia pennisetigena TaxID=1578925 RepID=UPI001151CEA0|nr:uncharacterized protein PpBr36_09523 [Pyricularia pennisetigena]TLS21826.1 hypothetical protein PpBr36_09523 [Pyricularia pennisetigena]